MTQSSHKRKKTSTRDDYAVRATQTDPPPRFIEGQDSPEVLVRTISCFPAHHPLWLQASYWYDMNSVFARVCESAAGDHHHESRLFNANAVIPRVSLTHEAAYLEKMVRTLFNLTVPQLEFDQGKSSIRKVQNTVGLKTVSVAVIR